MSEDFFVYASGDEIHAVRIGDNNELLMNFDEVRAHVTQHLHGRPYVGQFSFRQNSVESAVREVMEEWAVNVLDYQTTNPTRAAKLTIPVGATYSVNSRAIVTP